MSLGANQSRGRLLRALCRVRRNGKMTIFVACILGTESLPLRNQLDEWNEKREGEREIKNGCSFEMKWLNKSESIFRNSDDN